MTTPLTQQRKIILSESESITTVFVEQPLVCKLLEETACYVGPFSISCGGNLKLLCPKLLKSNVIPDQNQVWHVPSSAH